ncbi:MAG TPA: MscL family protein [Candidatus Saccharimonadales bacterium]|nr:MscL family protein [Candidatus Saccharimonadales bacterium]
MAKKTTETQAKMSAETNRRREVREVATKLRHLPPVAKAEVVNEVVTHQATKQFGGFIDFLREQSVVGLAIGLVLGTQIKQVVDQIMLHLVNPMTLLLLPGKEALSKKTFVLEWGGKEATFGWGAVVYTLFTFLIVAFLVYAAFKLLKLDRLTKKKDESAPAKDKKKDKKKSTK